jgi:hypothetical protein
MFTVYTLSLEIANYFNKGKCSGITLNIYNPLINKHSISRDIIMSGTIKFKCLVADMISVTRTYKLM